MAADNTAVVVTAVVSLSGAAGSVLTALLKGVWVPGATHEREIGELKREMGERLQRLEQELANERAEKQMYRAAMFKNLDVAQAASKAMVPARKARDGVA